MNCYLLRTALLFFILLGGSQLAFADGWEFGFGKVDITPTEPLRLSGYGGRKKPYESVAEKIWARAMVFQTTDNELSALVTVDNVGFPDTVTTVIANRVQKLHQIPRKRFVISCSHTHSAPHLDGGLKNLFAYPMSKQEQKKTNAYTRWLEEQVVIAVNNAVKNLAPGKLSYTMSEATFSRNRRLFKNGVRIGGIDPDGPVDHTLPILQVVGENGKPRGFVFNYACHCTSLGLNQVSGDWAGYACKFIEQDHPDCVAMCTIGCGGDINPIRSYQPKESIQLAKAAGREIADAVANITPKKMQPITAPFAAAYGHADLQIKPFPVAELKVNLKTGSAQHRFHAKYMLDLLAKQEHLPQSYPQPLHVWRFGNELMMVFMGGEVVIDYTIRLHGEVETKRLWVSSYCNDVFAYVASERVRQEGGYEADRSMIYYLQPGPWVRGTEEKVIQKINQLVKQTDN